MLERDMMFEEIDSLYLNLRDEHKATEKLNVD
jgi:hypothetical protein